MRVLATIAVTAGALLWGAGTAQAATERHVSPAGGGDCSSPASPCTLAQANAASGAGDTISLASGDYASLGDVSIAPGVVVVATGGRPVLHAGTLTLTGGALRDVTVSGTTSASVLTADGTVIERVIAQDEGGSPASICTFSGVIARDSVCQASHGDAAVTITGSGTSELRNVTAAAPRRGIVVSGPANVLVHNTSTRGHRNDLEVDHAGAAVAVDHSQLEFWSAPAGTLTLGPGIVPFWRPSYVNPWGNGDCDNLALGPNVPGANVPRPGSPAIDAGGDVAATETDVLGHPRALGTAPDIGAYEYQPFAPCVSALGTQAGDGHTVLFGAVNPHGASTTSWFEWGPTTAYGSSTAPRSSGTGTLTLPTWIAVDNPPAGATYHYRVVARNEHGTRYSADQTYTAPSPRTSTPPPATTPPPAASRAKPQVRIALPAAKRCRATRTLALRARIATGGTITAVSVYVRGKRTLRVTGARSRRTIRLKRLPAGRYTVEVRVRTKDGRTVKARRTYESCRKGA